MSPEKLARLDSLHNQESWTDADLVEINRLHEQFYHAFRAHIVPQMAPSPRLREPFRPLWDSHQSWEEKLSAECRAELDQ